MEFYPALPLDNCPFGQVCKATYTERILLRNRSTFRVLHRWNLRLEYFQFYHSLEKNLTILAPKFKLNFVSKPTEN